MRAHWAIGALIVVGLLAYLLLRWNAEPAARPAPPGKPQAWVERLEGELDLRAEAYRFVPNRVQARRARPLTLFVESAGDHSFVVPSLAVRALLRDGTNVLFVVPTRAGEFPFYCELPGHREQGMAGTLTVVDGPAAE